MKKQGDPGQHRSAHDRGRGWCGGTQTGGPVLAHPRGACGWDVAGPGARPGIPARTCGRLTASASGPRGNNAEFAAPVGTRTVRV
jgi:hypothetical protein